MSPLTISPISHLPRTSLLTIQPLQNGRGLSEEALDHIWLSAERLTYIEGLGGPAQGIQRRIAWTTLLIGLSHKSLNQAACMSHGSTQTRALAVILR